MKPNGRLLSMTRQETITHVVLRSSRIPPKGRWGLPALITLAVHAGVVLILPKHDSGERWALATAATVRAILAAQNARAIAPTRPHPEPPPPMEKPVESARPRPASAKRAANSQQATPPAQAAQIVARLPDDSQPVDLGEAFVIGGGTVYAGGTTTPTGSSTRAVEGPIENDPAPSGGRAGPNQARPIRLADPDWTCPWPKEADDTDIDEQAAVVRVAVDARGRCASATVVHDPGFGFGPQAAQCAKEARFLPALDATGQPIPGAAAVRVRFVR